MPQVSSALLLDMVATGKEFTIKNTQWRHSFDSARQRFFTMVFRCPPWFRALETASLKFPSPLLLYALSGGAADQHWRCWMMLSFFLLHLCSCTFLEVVQ